MAKTTKKRPIDALIPPSLWDAFREECNVMDHDIQKAWLASRGIDPVAAAAMRRRQIGERLSPEEFRRILEAKGWNNQLLARRYTLAHENISRHINNEQRDVLWDDALYGLPHFKQTKSGHGRSKGSHDEISIEAQEAAEQALKNIVEQIDDSVLNKALYTKSKKE